jgi:hypothetical protein
MYISEKYYHNYRNKRGISVAKGMLSSYITRQIFKKCTPIKNKNLRVVCKIRTLEKLIFKLNQLKNKCDKTQHSDVCKNFIQKKINHLNSKIVKYKMKLTQNNVNQYSFDPMKHNKNVGRHGY